MIDKSADWILQTANCCLKVPTTFPTALLSALRSMVVKGHIYLFPALGMSGICVVRKYIIVGKWDPTLIFHELVHVIGGKEIDAEAMEHLYTPNPSSPSVRDLALFSASDWTGEFVRVDPINGDIYLLDGDLYLGSFGWPR